MRRRSCFSGRRPSAQCRTGTGQVRPEAARWHLKSPYETPKISSVVAINRHNIIIKKEKEYNSCIYLISDGSNKPYRCHLKSPGFIHLQSLDYLTRGHLIADVTTVIGSLDIVFGDIDR